MNANSFLLLKELYKNTKSTQRELSKNFGWSLGMVNNNIKDLKKQNFLDGDLKLTKEAVTYLKNSHPKNAIILAAGFGFRMVPINQNKPKALLSVNDQTLIERLIEQLLEKGIKDITIVVGFMKEAFDYLTDKYKIKLVYNKDYALKNNLYSLACVKNKICNSYIIPCDLYCMENPFNEYERFTWYMVEKSTNKNSWVRVNKKGNLIYSKTLKSGNTMTGISFINSEDSVKLKEKIDELCKDKENDNDFWESALFEKNDICVTANLIESGKVLEINSYEDLRELDGHSKELKNESIAVICKVFNCDNKDIKDIKTLKKGMTNRSYIFTVHDKRYIMRIPGEGTEQLINRKEEADVYNAIKGYGICDELYYLNPKNGMKISAYVENSRCCNAYNDTDLKKCMNKLREFHNLKLKVKHEFNIYKKIDFYESLWSEESIFKDYKETKRNVLSLKSFIDICNPEYSLTHIDAIADNFLISKGKDKKEQIQLIDWEYASMQDVHVDIAMFFIILCDNRKELLDHFIDVYFEGNCTLQNRIKIYCYVSLCGLLWSNWCEYKRQLGVEFGEYSLMQYRFAKDFYKIAEQEIKKLEPVNE